MPALVPPVLHPIAVHAPLVLLPLAALTAFLHGRWRGARTATRWLLTFAAVTAILAVFTGLDIKPDSLEAWEGTAKESWIDTHQVLGLATMAVTVVLAVLAWIPAVRFLGRLPWAWAVAVMLPMLLVGATGWYGGAIVWEELPPPTFSFDAAATGSDGGAADTIDPEPTQDPPADPGPGDGGTGGPAGGGNQSEPEPEPSPAAPEPGCDDSAGGFTGQKNGEIGPNGLPVWTITVDAESGFHYSLDQIIIPVGCDVELTFRNADSARHDLAIGEDGSIAQSQRISGGQTELLQFPTDQALQAPFYCSVGTHRAKGQEGTLTVQ